GMASLLTTTLVREDTMMHLRSSVGGSLCSCGACNSQPALSRRQFLCTTAATAIAASTVVGTASAQQPGGATAPGRAILIKGGCVLPLPRPLADFPHAA